VVSLGLGLSLAGVACAHDAATPVQDTAPTTGQLTPHLLEPTEQMKALARQQCLDHPDRTQGVVNAVDPGRPGQILASVALDCASVRAGASGETSSTTVPPAAASASTLPSSVPS
jgi:hypothetical protein